MTNGLMRGGEGVRFGFIYFYNLLTIRVRLYRLIRRKTRRGNEAKTELSVRMAAIVDVDIAFDSHFLTHFDYLHGLLHLAKFLSRSCAHTTENVTVGQSEMASVFRFEQKMVIRAIIVSLK